jgi:branched-subunit amino acid aminotransferase/4-amino-4-deoxychorismate lyase
MVDDPNSPGPGAQHESWLATGYWSGRWVAASQIGLPLDDAGLTHGVLIAEQLRTFAGQPLLLDRHLHRLARGAETTGIPLDRDSAKHAILGVIEKNQGDIAPGADMRVSILVTPGRCGASTATTPTVIVTAARLPFRQMARWYRGIHLVTAETRELPADCVPREIKHRNRIHYWLAERQAQRVDPEARALLLDHSGHICEGTTATIVIVPDGGMLVAPPDDRVLPGTSLEVTMELARRGGWRTARRPFTREEVAAAREVLWLSAPVGIAPVTRFDNSPIGDGAPGTGYRQLINAWGAATGVDLQAQAEAFA